MDCLKILAAGALKPEDGIKHAYNNGADFTCVGMFDWQIVEDINISNDAYKGALASGRKRKFL